MINEEHSLTPRQHTFLKRLTSAKDRLMAALDGLAPQVICGQPVLESWTVKDLLGHIVSWNEEFRANITDILEGRHPGFEYQISGEDDFAASNQAWIERKRNFPLAKILEDLQKDYIEAVQLIQNLTPEQLSLRGVTPWKAAAFSRRMEPIKENTDSVQTLVTFHWRHMNEHCHQIETWRKGWERTQSNEKVQ